LGHKIVDVADNRRNSRNSFALEGVDHRGRHVEGQNASLAVTEAFREGNRIKTAASAYVDDLEGRRGFEFLELID